MTEAETEAIREVAEHFHDPVWMCSRMSIQTKDGQLTTLADIHGEQLQTILALTNAMNVCVLKSRQMGITTVVCAFMVWRVLTAGGAYDCLTVVHEHRAVGRVNAILLAMIKGLPEPIRPEILTARAEAICIKFAGHVSWFRQVMAGGRDQGRSYSYRLVHFTEEAFYPRGSRAKAGSGLDATVVRSILSTMPTPEKDPKRLVIHESTADGPAGVFYETVHNAMSGNGWAFLFFPWYDFSEYSMDATGVVPNEEEQKLMRDNPRITLRNIAFRRYKMISESYTLSSFRKEYPTTPEDPFMVSGAMWFDVEVLNRYAARAVTRRTPVRGGVRRYLKYEKHRRYFGAHDACGGAKRDNGVSVIVRDDLAVAAVYSSNTDAPHVQGDHLAMLASEYNCGFLIEQGNQWGRAVKKAAVALKVRMWVTQEDKDFVTDRKTKAVIYDWAKQKVDNEESELNDPTLISELQRIREQDDGTIQGDAGFKDDHAMAFCLALHAARRFNTTPKSEPTPEQRMRDRLERLGTG